jgi:hypothetical protein
MAVKQPIPHLSVDQRQARGREARDRTPLGTHAGWAPARDRRDPVGLLEDQDATREPDLVPVRHGRMLVSPFTFYRGAARIMAADLAGTPTAGLDVQLCGDAHLSNFGFFASPERRLLVDLNDFDETLPGPFEFDVKRMAASFTIAGRNNGFTKADTKAVTRASVREYREAMAGFAAMGTMQVWYARLDEDLLLQALRVEASASTRKAAKKLARQAQKSAEKLFATGSSASPPSSSHPGTWKPPSAAPARRSSVGSRSISVPTGPPSAAITAGCWSASRSWMWPARWWALAASAPGPTSSCSRAATSTTPCSSRSRRRPPRSWRTTCPAAGTASTASGWWTANG